MRKEQLSIWGFALLSLVGFGQAEPDKRYTTHDGLPQIQIIDVCQDKLGQLWVNTKKGMANFDGQQFHQILDKSGQSFSAGTLIDQDLDGNIVFNSGNNLIRYDGVNIDTVYKYKSLNNYLSLAFLDNGLYAVLEKNDQKIYLIDSKGTKKDSIKLEFANSRLFNDNGKVHVLSYLEGHQGCELFTLSNNKLQSTKTWPIRVIIKHNGNKAAFYEEHLEKNKIVKYRLIDISQDFKPLLEFKINTNKSLFDIKYLDSLKSDFWYSGLSVLYRFTPEGTKKYALSNNTRIIPFVDLDGNVIVSNEHGLSVYLKHNFTSFPIGTISDVWSINKLNGNYYTSHYSDGVYQFFPEESRTKKIPPNGNRLNMYFGSSTNGNSIFFPAAYGFVIVDKNGNRTDYFDRAKFTQLLSSVYDEKQKRYIGGGLNEILFFDPNTKKTELIKDSSKQKIGFYTEIFQSDNTLWIGSYKGIKQFDLNDKKFNDFNHLFEDQDDVSAISIEIDGNKRLWVGGKNGLFFKKEDDKFLKSFDDYLKGKMILDIKFIPSKNLLAVGTNSEIFFIDLTHDLSNPEIKEYNFRNGFLGEEIAQNGFLLDGNTLWIPSATVLSNIDLSEISFEENYTNLSFYSVNKKSLGLNFESGDTIVLNKGENNINVTFGGIGMGHPIKRQYKYKLDEHDQEWSDWTSKEDVGYTNLSSGIYKFKLKGKRVIGSSPIEKNLFIKVDLSLFQEPGFYKLVSVALVVLLLTGLAFLYFIRLLFLENREKETSINYLRNQRLRSQMNPHFIFNVLTSIQSLVLNKKTEEANKHLVSFSKLIRRYLDSSVVASKINAESNKIELVSLQNEIELLTLYLEFEQLQKPGRIKFVFEIDENIEVANESIPPMIIQPFVENAVKHGLLPKDESGLLTIRFFQKDKDLICEVEDNGIGIALSKKRKIEKQLSHRSLGTTLVNERIEILNKLYYQIETETINKNEGTLIIIKFRNN